MMIIRGTFWTNSEKSLRWFMPPVKGLGAQGTDSPLTLTLGLGAAKTGSLHMNKQNTPLFPTGIEESDKVNHISNILYDNQRPRADMNSS